MVKGIVSDALVLEERSNGTLKRSYFYADQGEGSLV